MNFFGSSYVARTPFRLVSVVPLPSKSCGLSESVARRFGRVLHNRVRMFYRRQSRRVHKRDRQFVLLLTEFRLFVTKLTLELCGYQARL